MHSLEMIKHLNLPRAALVCQRCGRPTKRPLYHPDIRICSCPPKEQRTGSKTT